MDVLLWANPYLIAKKEDNPEQALKEFRAIVAQEEEKGDWFVIRVWKYEQQFNSGVLKGIQGTEAINQTIISYTPPTKRCPPDLHRTFSLHKVRSYKELL